MKIDFAIVGAQKSGTTALVDMLKQHPSICFPEEKEDTFFANPTVYSKGSGYLNRLYTNFQDNQVAGYAYVNLMYYKNITVPRLHKNNPRMKIVAVLRDPIERAYSAYWFIRARGFERSKSFEEAFSKELHGQLELHDFNVASDQTYLAHGHYAEQLAPFFEAFGRENVKVYFQEELYADYRAVCEDIFNYLGLADIHYPVDQRMSNRAAKPVIKALPKLIYGDSLLKTSYKYLVSESLRAIIRKKVVRKLKSVNLKYEKYPPMSSTTRKELQKYYAPHNRELESLLDRKLPFLDAQ